MARYFFATVGLWLLLNWLAAYPASAHATLQRSVPAAGAQLDHSPATITLWFENAIKPGSTFTLYHANFNEIPLAVQFDSLLPNQLDAVVPDLSAGAYTVQWLSIGTDGDALRGQFGFRVQPAFANHWFYLLSGLGLLGCTFVLVHLWQQQRSGLTMHPDR